MSSLQSLATHLPLWGSGATRTAGPDEDAVTLAVAAGRAAIAAAPRAIESVVLVSRDLPYLDGGSEAVLVAGLGLPDGVRCSFVLGGAPAALDELATAGPGTLLIAADVAPSAAAAAAVVGEHGATISACGRTGRSLPTRVRDTSGGVFDYDDPRLVRERGTGAALAHLRLADKPVALAGLAPKETANHVAAPVGPLPTTGSSAALFALADAIDRGVDGVVVAVEQASAVAVTLRGGDTARATHAPAGRPMPTRKETAGGDIKISLPAYERAFDGKLRLQAGRCTACGNLDLPQRYRCSSCGAENSSELAPLPRTGTVYTAVSIHVPVPGLQTPYDLAIVELGETGVRLLAPVTDAAPGTVVIDDAGTLVLRRMATRGGVPDYGYAFLPDASTATVIEGAGA